MARIRSVHPGIWTDADFVGMSAHARLLMIGIWNEADDFGVLAWKPLDLKIKLLPGDNVDAAALMQEIVSAGFLVRIERGCRPYAVVKNFRKFQRPKNPSAPIIPIDEEINGIIFGTSTPVLPQPYPSPTENPPQMEDGGDKREEGREEGGGGSASARDPHDEILLAAGVDPSKDVTGKWHSSGALWEAGRWRSQLGLSQQEILTVVRETRNGKSPGSLAYFTAAMERFAGRKSAPPLNPDTTAAQGAPPRFDVAAAVERAKAEIEQGRT